MGKPTERQKARKAILEGIVDTEHRSEVAISLTGGKEQLLINTTREEVVKAISDSTATGNTENAYVTFETFRWGGSRANTMMLFTVSYRAADIIEVVEITEDMWDDYVANQAARMASPQGGGGLQVPQVVPPPGGMN